MSNLGDEEHVAGTSAGSGSCPQKGPPKKKSRFWRARRTTGVAAEDAVDSVLRRFEVKDGTAGSRLDVIQCAALNGSSPCHATGSPSYSTQYESLDRDGTPRFTTEFWFVSEDNLIAFENAPYSYTPKYGGFCAWAISNLNETLTTAPWSRSWLGPPADLLSSWRVVTNEVTGESATYLFGGELGAQKFLAGLPETAVKADKVWAGWWGRHGVEPPYAIDGGPFNSACFTKGGNKSGKPRDCTKDPQPLPPLAGMLQDTMLHTP